MHRHHRTGQDFALAYQTGRKLFRPAFLLVAVLACASPGAGKSSDAGAGDADGGSDAGNQTPPDGGTPGGDAGGCRPAPAVHRPSPVACPTSRPAVTPAPTDGGSGMCLEDSDCDGGANGRCASEVGNSSVRICSYDQCFADTDCGANEDGGVCECRGPAQPTGPNFCIPSNCREDSDCGECGYCAASPGGCAPNIGIAGWFCGTRLDECAEGSDCGNIPNIYCAFDPLVGYWKCIPADCTG